MANRALDYSAIFWFLVILAGQWFFFYYIMAFYGYSVITNNMAIWNYWEVMGVTPYVDGDTGGNLAFAAHSVGAGIVAFGGAVQLMPWVRKHLPKFHKINGYLYLVTVVALALSGYYLVYVRDEDPLDLNGIGTSINGVLILTFAYFTVTRAINKDIANHRRWALRLFLVSNAQWFLRLGMFSYLISGKLTGFDAAFGDPFFSFWTFGCYLVPLAMLELFFFAKDSKLPAIKVGASIVLLALTILMIIGMIGFTPFLLKVIAAV